MNSKQLKILAVISMLICHINLVFRFDRVLLIISNWFASIGQERMSSLLRSYSSHIVLYFGRLAAPIFMFCIVQGFAHTKDIRKYILRVLITAYIAQIPYIMFFLARDYQYGVANWMYIKLNILFTLGLGLISLWVFQQCRRRNKTLLGFLTIILTAFIARFCRLEGGDGYILIIFAFYLTQNSKPWKKALTMLPIVLVAKYRLIVGYFIHDWSTIGNCILNVFGPYLGVLVTCFYSHEKGNISKRFQRFMYAFYPLHFLVLAIAVYLRTPLIR